MNYPNPYGPVYGTGAIPVMPKAKNTQPLTPEMIAKLRSGGAGFKIEVSQEDLWRASCTHKENGVPTLVEEGVIKTEDGREMQVVRCTICGETFVITDASNAEVKKAVDTILNLLQTIKLFYVDAPESLIVQYFQMIPLLKMLVPLYERAFNNFNKYESAMDNNGIMMPGVSGSNGFQILGQMLANPYMAAFGGQVPNGAYPPPPPGGYGMYYPTAPVQPDPNQAGMYAGYSVQPTAGVAPTGAYNPYNGSPLMAPAPQAPAGVAPAPAPAPAAPATAPQAGATPEVSQTKQFNV